MPEIFAGSNSDVIANKTVNSHKKNCYEKNTFSNNRKE